MSELLDESWCLIEAGILLSELRAAWSLVWSLWLWLGRNDKRARKWASPTLHLFLFSYIGPFSTSDSLSHLGLTVYPLRDKSSLGIKTSLEFLAVLNQETSLTMTQL